jgi:hypothetical protein
VDDGPVGVYRAQGAMTALTDHPALGQVPDDLDALRGIVQGLVLQRDWAPAVRMSEPTSCRPGPSASTSEISS